MNRTQSPVATWFFERGDVPDNGYQEAGVRHVALFTWEALRIMTAHKLLFPEQIVLDQWVPPGDGTAETAPVYATCTASAANDLDAFTTMIIALTRSRGLLPTRVEVTGKTLVFNAAGAGMPIDRVVNLEGYAFTHFGLRVNTYADVWLPFNLYGEDQAETYRHNAPRLTNALAELENLPDVTSSDAGPTKYASVSGFELDNHRDHTGEPVPVLFD